MCFPGSRTPASRSATAASDWRCPHTGGHEQQRAAPECPLLHKGRREGALRPVSGPPGTSVRLRPRLRPQRPGPGRAAPPRGQSVWSGPPAECAETEGGLCTARDHTHARPQPLSGQSWVPLPRAARTQGHSEGGSPGTSPSDSEGEEKGGREPSRLLGAARTRHRGRPAALGKSPASKTRVLPTSHLRPGGAQGHGPRDRGMSGSRPGDAPKSGGPPTQGPHAEGTRARLHEPGHAGFRSDFPAAAVTELAA